MVVTSMLIQRYEDAQHYRATHLFHFLSSMDDFSLFRGLIQYLVFTSIADTIV